MVGYALKCDLGVPLRIQVSNLRKLKRALLDFYEDDLHMDTKNVSALDESEGAWLGPDGVVGPRRRDVCRVCVCVCAYIFHHFKE